MSEENRFGLLLKLSGIVWSTLILFKSNQEEPLNLKGYQTNLFETHFRPSVDNLHRIS